MRRECPNCREPVPFLLSFRKPAWKTFPCPACGSILRGSLGRRLVAGIVGLAVIIFLGEVVGIMRYGRLADYSILLAVLAVCFFLFEGVTLVERRAFTCKKCGYDLEGLPEPRCPECATPFDPQERERILARIAAPAPPPPKRWVAILVVILLALLVAGSLTAVLITARGGLRPGPPTTPPPTQPSTPGPG